jgi:hypothetical protein
MNQLNDKGERHGYWETHWDTLEYSLKKPRYICKGNYDNGIPIGLFQYYSYNRKLHTKEFHL